MDKQQLSIKTMKHSENLNFETMLISVYGNGLYQIMFVVFCSMTSFMTGFDLQTMLFMHYIPEFRCTDNRLNNDTHILWISKTSKHTLTTSSLLSKNQINLTNLNQTSNHSEQCWGLLMNNNTLFECNYWVYDQSEMLNTVVTQFNLICDKSNWLPWMESSVLFSSAVGFLIASSSDLFGRRKLYLALALWDLCISLSTLFVNTIELLILLRFLRGFAVAMNYLGVSLVSELVPLKKRAMYGNNYWISWGIGCIVCAGLAYWLRDWYFLRLYGCTLFIFYLTFIYFFCESPRWLALHNRDEDVINILRRIATWNKPKLDKKFYENVRNFLIYQKNIQNIEISTSQLINKNKYPLNHKQNDKNNKKSDQIMHLFKYTTLLTRTLLLFFIHSTFAFVYYGLITDSSFANTNIFLNVLIMGLIEIPIPFVGWQISLHFGRRMSITILLCLCGISIILNEILKYYSQILQAIFAILGKFAITTGFSINILYISELYPTSIRTRSLFMIITIAGLMSSLGPFVNNSDKLWLYLPCLIYSVTCFISAFLVIKLMPETNGCPLSQNMQEANELKCGNEKEWTKKMDEKYEYLIETDIIQMNIMNNNNDQKFFITHK